MGLQILFSANLSTLEKEVYSYIPHYVGLQIFLFILTMLESEVHSKIPHYVGLKFFFGHPHNVGV